MKYYNVCQGEKTYKFGSNTRLSRDCHFYTPNFYYDAFIKAAAICLQRLTRFFFPYEFFLFRSGRFALVEIYFIQNQGS